MAAERLAGGLRFLRHLEDGLLALLLAAMVLLASGQILLRNAFDAALPWADPLLRALVLWVGLFGALVASRENRHIAIDAVSRFLPRRARGPARALTSLFTAAVSATVAYHAVRFVASDYRAGVEALAGVPAWLVETVVPFAFGATAFRYLVLFAAELRGAEPPR